MGLGASQFGMPGSWSPAVVVLSVVEEGHLP